MCVIVTCWPTETPTGCDVSVEYELTNTDLELNDVAITIPLPYVSVLRTMFRVDLLLYLK